LLVDWQLFDPLMAKEDPLFHVNLVKILPIFLFGIITTLVSLFSFFAIRWFFPSQPKQQAYE